MKLQTIRSIAVTWVSAAEVGLVEDRDKVGSLEQALSKLVFDKCCWTEEVVSS